MGNINIVKATCIECEEEFTYVRYKVDKKFCSKTCTNKHRYKVRADYPLRQRRIKRDEKEKRLRKAAYDREYSARPEVKARKNERSRLLYRTEAYRAYARDRYYRLYASNPYGVSSPDLSMGYSDPIFDDLKKIVGQPPRWDAPWFDLWADKMGAAVLAQAEGRDVQEAIKEFKKGENQSLYRTVYFSEFNQNDAYQLDKILATEDLTEAEALEKITRSEASEVAPRFHMGSGTVPFGTGYNKTRTKPTRRGKYRPWQDQPGHRRHA